MASTLHVKQKSAWRRVAIPQNLIDSEEFDGLIDIQELTDYDLLQVDNSVYFDDENHGKRAKSLKRKLQRHEIPEEKELENGKLEPLPKKAKSSKKQTSSQKKSEDNSREVYSSSGSLNEQASDEIRKGETVKNVNIDNVDEGMNLDSTFSPKSTTHIGDKKMKKKRKKKKSQKGRILPISKLNMASTKNKSEGNGEETKEKEASKASIDMSLWKNLYVPEVILRALQDQGFDKPTEIQSLALPSAIKEKKDIFGAAETGSGKTFAFGIPTLTRILNLPHIQIKVPSKEFVGVDQTFNTIKKEEDGCEKDKESGLPPLALILEPTRELAVQVKNHLSLLAKYTNIKFATVVGGMSIEKQRRVLSKHPHVIIATPGRLWQLIEEGDEHLSQVDKILCLVVDEADRMVEKGHYEELTKILEMLNNSPRKAKNRQTFVMSATLTMDVAIPKRLMKHKKPPKKDMDKLKSLTERICVGLKPKIIDLTPRDKVSQTLTELRVNCKADEKDFYLYYFLCQHPGRTLVFANSKDCLRRLVALFTLLKCSPLPLHADMHQRQRLKNLDTFAGSSHALLIASDVAARGLDIPKVDHVIHYQVPRTMENYVHRSGRTARASNLGLSVMLVGPEDAKDYRKIVHGVRNGEELPLMPVELELIPAVKQRVALARDIDVKEYRMKKKRMKNNFFIKAAEEMDMIVDDDKLLEDLGDSVQQAQDKQLLKQMKAQLEMMLRYTLQPMRMSKYPTKSGQLILKKPVNLLNKKK